MHIEIRCNCGGHFQFPPESAGQVFQCGSCGAPISIPINAELKSSPVDHLPTLPSAPVKPAKPQYETSHLPQPSPSRAPSNASASGCWSGILGLLLVGAILFGIGWYATRMIWSAFDSAVSQVSGWVGLVEGMEDLGNIDQVIEEYKTKGYESHFGPWINSTEPVIPKTIFACQVLELDCDAKADIAILAQAATIRGTVEGDIEFMGQALVIAKGAHVKGNIHSRLAQLITVEGTVDGKLTGGYQMLQGSDKVNGGAGNPDSAKNLVQTIQKKITGKRSSNSLDLATFSSSLHAIMKGMEDSSFLKQRRALKSLAKISPIASDRDKIVQLLIERLPDEIHNDSEIIKALEKWGGEGDAELLTKAISKARSSNIASMIELLEKWKSEKELISLINHSDYRTRNLARRTLSELKVDDNKIFVRHIQDLKNSPRSHHSILPHLLTLKLKPGTMDENAKTSLIKLLNNVAVTPNDLCEFLKPHITPSDSKTLLALKTDIYRSAPKLNLILKTGVDEVYQRVAKHAYKSRLAKIDPEHQAKIESYWIQDLTGPNSQKKITTCQLLQSYGSAACIPHLKKLAAKDDFLGRRAKSALTSIERRMRRISR